ncbi:MAG: DegT/DnrJ/EryC1/StrS family aminotransferase [Spirochaetales bacterium]|nr:DegT/DnrJ/EryC1/StrS family aminotransferase [Spirochaetales bacterium]
MDSVLTTLVEDRPGSDRLGTELAKAVKNRLAVSGAVALREYQRAVFFALEIAGLETGSTVFLSPLLPSWYLDVCALKGIKTEIFDLTEAAFVPGREVSDKLSSQLPEEGSEAGDGPVVIMATSLGYIPDYYAFEQAGWTMIEDITEGFGGFLGERSVGGFGCCSVLATEQEGVITTGGGALILTQKKRKAGELKRMSEQLHHEQMMPDMNAALGLAQMNRIDAALERRREIEGIFRRALMQSGHSLPVQPASEEAEIHRIPYGFPVLLKSGMKDAVKYAAKHGVEAAPAFSGTIAATEAAESCPVARDLARRTLLFPLYPALTSTEVEAVRKVLTTLP